MDEAVRNLRGVEEDKMEHDMVVDAEPSESRLAGNDWSDSEESDSNLSEMLDAESSIESVETDSECEPADQWQEKCPTRRQMPKPPSRAIDIDDAAKLTPGDYFKVMFNTFFLQQLASWINWHASEMKARGNHRPQSRILSWKDTNETEMLTFLGVLFFMGTVKMNKINDYWRKSHMVTLALGKYMSRNRFLLILKCLYFTSADVSQNIYSAIEPFVNYFNQLMRDIIYPGKELIIDESIIGFRGRLNIRKYIKNMSYKYGIKLYILACPEGLVHKFYAYKGQTDSEVSGQSHVDKVVKKLLDGYLEAGHAVYMDKFYTSVNLAEYLLSKKTYCTGTLLANRKRNPRFVTSKKLSKGGFIYRYNKKGVCVMKWKNKRDMITISTEHTHDMVDVVVRGRQISEPFMVTQYNKIMKGIDRHDQMLAYYPPGLKSSRWYKTVGIYMLQTMFVNAYFLYKIGTGKQIRLEQFRESVLESLLPPPLASKTRSTGPSHMPRDLSRNEDGVKRRRRCVRCWSLFKKRKDSPLYCPDCDMGLCIGCYRQYHEENNLV